MKKKGVLISVLVALLLMIALPVLAASDNPDLTWFKQRMEAKKAYVDQAVQNGQMTQEQGQVWKNHFDSMVQFHEQNGFICPGGGKMGGGPGMGAGCGMRGQGFGPGWQAQNSQ